MSFLQYNGQQKKTFVEQLKNKKNNNNNKTKQG